MNPSAINKAYSRLTKIKHAVALMEGAEDVVAIDAAWQMFIVEAHGIYSTLEQGAKTSAQSMQWFGAKKAQRKADELLQYIFQARNEQEHTLNFVTDMKPGTLVVGPGHLMESGKKFHTHLVIKDDKVTTLDAKYDDGSPLPVIFKPATLRLLPIVARGVAYNPPVSHLGKIIGDQSPITIANLGVVYFELLLKEASALS